MDPDAQVEFAGVCPAGGVEAGGLAGLLSGDCDQAGTPIRTPAQITNVKRTILAALFRRRVISRPGIHP